jgi:hypothetical protein
MPVSHPWPTILNEALTALLPFLASCSTLCCGCSVYSPPSKHGLQFPNSVSWIPQGYIEYLHGEDTRVGDVNRSKVRASPFKRLWHLLLIAWLPPFQPGSPP